MALAIGACTAVFSLLEATVLRPLPYPNADSLYDVWSVYRQRHFETPVLAGEKYENLFEQRDLFAEVAVLSAEPELLTYTGAARIRRWCRRHLPR